MIRTTVIGMRLLALICGLLLSPAASAQQASGIAGVVKDPSGAVLPGVTVEAASPALIEQVRTVVTDGQGRYNIVDLKPGSYVVTFNLVGFTTVRREGIALTTGFTATVNADLAVGSVGETITVTGDSPLIDLQNVRQQQVITSELLDALPVYSVVATAIMSTVLGISSATRADVGGSLGNHQAQNMLAGGVSFHGKAGSLKMIFDGMRVNSMEGNTGYLVQNVVVEEMAVETGGISAESSASNGAVNVIPKSGGNIFSGNISSLFSTHGMQSGNIDDELRARGLTDGNKVDLLNLYDVSGTLGGPVKRDRLWFFTAHRINGLELENGPFPYNKTQGTPFYTPDPTRPALKEDWYRSNAVRVTWQASQRNKVSGFADVQELCLCPNPTSGNSAPEAIFGRYGHNRLYQLSWTLPATNRFLFEAGISAALFSLPARREEQGVGPNDISIRELSTGFVYNALRSFGISGYDNGHKVSHRYSQRFALSYVTGTHAFKTGVNLDEGVRDFDQVVNGDVWYDFLNGRPSAITQFATPYRTQNKQKMDLGLFVQDQWTLNRLTMNLGLRFEYFNAYVPETDLPAGPFVPARKFAAVKDVPNWKDLNPRLGMAYDLFGTGRTALKLSFGRFMSTAGNTLALADGNNPLVTSVNQVTRAWNDINGNYIPDCDLRNPAQNGECEPYQNQNFGKLNITTRYADDVLRGYGVRPSFWDFGTELQHELGPGISVNGGYYRNWYDNFTVTDNLSVTPADYSEYCVLAPVDTRLPNGGGYQVCGLYDVAPTKLGQINNLVVPASTYGKQTQVSDFFAVNLNTRFGPSMRLGGGVDTGRTVTDNCFVIDSPQALLNCRVVTPFKGQTQVKVFGSYTLPADVVVSATLQNLSGPPILASYTVTRAQVLGLGRPLSTSTATIPLIVPGTLFEGRRTQLDVRLTKVIRLGRTRLQATLDLYNALNGNAVTSRNDTYGGSWGLPQILAGRLIHVGGALTF